MTDTDQSPEALRFLGQNVYLNVSSIIDELIQVHSQLGTLHDQEWYEELYLQHSVTQIEDEDGCVEEDYNDREPYEVWCVSSYLFSHFEDQDELVSNSWGLYLWGRETTGQSILLDHSFQEAWKKHNS